MISYDGQWSNGRYNGWGKMVRGNVTYEGEWKDGCLHGYVIAVSTMYTFKGNYSEGLAQGFGIMIMANGQVFEGMWSGNNFVGKK